MSLSAETIRALVSGEHGDPIAVLGPHRDATGTLVIRAFVPGAVHVDVALEGSATRPGRLLDPAGLWEARLDDAGSPDLPPPRYRLRVTYGGGYSQEVEDAYRFPTALSDYDLHLLCEGTHYRVYDKLGAHQARLDGVAGVIFGVWAPNARRVSEVGDWNGWAFFATAELDRRAK